MYHFDASWFVACNDALKQGVRSTIILPLGGPEGFSSLPRSTAA
jgi:hypothetical protein